MTVNSEVSRSGPYNGNGATTVFPYDFKIFTAADLLVTEVDLDGVETTLVLNTDYTVDGVLSDDGGDVTLTTALAGDGTDAGSHKLTIRRVLDATQTMNLRSQGKISAEVLERAHDRAIMLIQQLIDENARSLRLAESETGSELLTILPALADRKGKQLTFDPTTGQPVASNPSSAAVSVAMQALVASATLALGRAVLQVNTADRINVKDSPYLAVGDGTNDDTSEIQSAQTAFPHVPLAFPPGVYKATAAPASPLVGAGASLSGVARRVFQADVPDDLEFDLGELAKRDGAKFVITGDSLSFNAYDWPGAVGLTPAGNAYDNPPGLMSWSFMLRDFIHRADPWFRHADQLPYLLSAGGMVVTINGATAYTAPFNDRYAELGGTAAGSTITFLYRHQNRSTNKLVLYLMNNPNANACMFDVYVTPHGGARTLTNADVVASGRTGFNGFAPFTLTATLSGNLAGPSVIEFTNFRNADGSAITGTKTFFLLGVGSKAATVSLTGHGGWNVADLVADFTARIGTYVPDVVFCICGANDRTLRTRDQYAADLRTLVASTLAINPRCKFICLGPLAASDSGYGLGETKTVSGSTTTMQEFLNAGRNAVIGSGGWWFDAYELTRLIDPAVWRYDNVHMTRAGNRILFEALISRYFRTAIKSDDLEFYDPNIQADSSANFRFRDDFTPRPAWRIVQYDNGGGKVYNTLNQSDDDKVIASVTRVNAYTLRVTLNYPVRRNAASQMQPRMPRVTHYAGSALFVTTRVNTISANVFEVFLLNALTATLVTDVNNDTNQYLIEV